ncbi:tripartite ATP-independent transporter DctP family solute receptor [Evansella vedderi]|uniref:Tripartite ATP-independent transporter DctP family solute receptor n=1 Tax=Evansella vedderi TaxID=38282 RepID=A0ABT9ZXD5_9BACI|nr:sialic acid TRAP transporter substrate-binding protein SiaP [Evansella vedderi]MDQ0255891.1 tripartite ATP-independent transporter DctP family solute receptor [Evansella vedderi]
MKKMVGLLVALLLTIMMAACGETETDSEAGGNGGTDAGTGSDEGSSTEEATEPEEEEVVLQFGMVAGTQSNEYKAANFLAEYVEEHSNGSLKIDVFPDSQLGDDRAMIDQLQEGTLDLTFSETGRFGIWVPRAELLGLPYIVDDIEHLKRVVYDTTYGQELHEELLNDFNLRILGIAYNGTRQTTSNREINSLEDMKGLKLRVPQAQTLLDYASYSGASPTPMAFTEVYLALQTNAVDGQENPLSTIEAMKFYEVQDYLAMTNHVVNDANYVVSESTWNKLSENQRNILQAGVEAAAAYHTELFETEESDLISYFEEQGVTITYPDLDEFRAAVSEAYPSYFDGIGENAEEYMAEIDEVR